MFTPGSGNPEGEDNVVQWVHTAGETITRKMGYNKGRLLVEKEGHYYLYSKVTLNAAEECSLIQHKVMKVTKAYGQPIELMKSKRLVNVPHLASFFCRCTCACKCLLESSLFVTSLGVFKGKLKSVLSSFCCGKFALSHLRHVFS